MTDSLIPADFERRITLGLSRAPSKGDDNAALATLTLLAQHKRHRRHAVDVKTTGSRLHDDPRPIMPAAARRPLTRLATSLPKDGWAYLGHAVFDRLDARSVRLHPFDLPRLEPLLGACSDRLGLAERAWLTFRKPAQEAPPSDAVGDSEADWALLPMSQKAAQIRQMRLKDTDAARGWVERHLATAPADVRAALIEALEPGLSPADATLLERLAKEDRAQSVRDAATELLSATPGSDAYAAKLAAAITLVGQGRTLLGRRTIKFDAAALAKMIDLPANASTGARNTAAAEALQRMFKNLIFSDVAKALSLSAEDLVAAINADDALAAPLAVAALREGDAAVAAKMIPHLAKLGFSELVGRFGRLLTNLPQTTRASLLEALTPSVLQWRWAFELQWLGRMAGGVVSDALARKMLSGGVWRSTEAPSVDAATYAVFASLMPRGRDADFAAAIADLPRKETAAAYEFIAFAAALEGTPT